MQVQPIPMASWPQSLPHPEENEFLSLVMNSDSIRWSLHVRMDNHFRAKYWWTTNGGIMLDNTEEMPKFMDLLPPVVIPLFKGNRKGPDAIQEWSFVKRIPSWTVYVMPEQPDSAVDAAALQHIFQGIPCRLFCLQWSDFFRQQPQTSQIPLRFLSSLKACQSDAKQEQGPVLSVLVIDTKRRELEYAACDGAKVLGYGVGPPLLDISIHSSKHVFSLSKQSHDVSSFLHILGIVKAWEQRCKGPRKIIWIEGDKAKLVHSVLLQNKGIRATIGYILDLVHYGVDVVIREQIESSGELNEPLDRLFVGQRVKLGTALGTVVSNSQPREEYANILEYTYNVEFDDGKRQQVLNIQHVAASILFYVKHIEEQNTLALLDPEDEYARMLSSKVEMAKSAIVLFEKELRRLQLDKDRVSADGTSQQVSDDYIIVNSTGKTTNKRKAAEEADPEAPRKRAYVGQRVAKYFGKKLYFGTISGWDPAAMVDDKLDLWKVDYDDGDFEDYEEFEVKQALKRYEQEKKRDPEIR